MTDHAQPGPDDDAVRRLLADARQTEPMPDDVAARMDAVLADLAAESPATPQTPAAARDAAPLHPVVVSLDVHRRRRAAGMLVAAAAIVVGGVVVAQHLPGGSNQSGSATAGPAEDRAGSTAAGNGNDSGARSPAPDASLPGKLTAGSAVVHQGRVLVRPQHFTADAVAARRLVEEKVPASAYSRLGEVDASCAVPSLPGRRVNATYQQAPAVLVFHPPVSSAQVVDLYLCGSHRPVRSATLPSP